ncbi:hypothetical protein K438DRAFT_196422 [Mycena galopus ATCC 62051]|nr:hypothetical protein K438DRAFT_196422 [Mycena galopus ATCC 62051]
MRTGSSPMPTSPAVPSSKWRRPCWVLASTSNDVVTKLSDRVRRRCFNFCITNTSTWRRINLSPSQVLSNKCGLLGRTHSYPRPEQFPQKRGALVSSTLARPHSISSRFSHHITKIKAKILPSTTPSLFPVSAVPAPLTRSPPHSRCRGIRVGGIITPQDARFPTAHRTVPPTHSPFLILGL